MRLLVVKYRAMGDAVMGLATLQYLKDLIPGVHITYAVLPWIVPLFQNINCAADKVVPIDLGNFREWRKDWNYFKKQEIDAIIELHQAGRTRKFLRLLSWYKWCPYFAHNHNAGESIKAPNIQRDLDGLSFVIDKISSLSSTASVVATSPELRSPNFLNYRPQMSPKMVRDGSPSSSTNQKTVILGVVATRQTKMWPLHYFKELIDIFIKENGDEYKFLIPLSNSPTDRAILEQMKLLGFDLAGATRENNRIEVITAPLSELPLYLSKACLYIGNDTGLKHIAVALGIKSLTFFGPEEPFEWHPYSRTEHDYLFLEQLSCRTATAHFCGLKTCSSMICLNSFTPQKTYDYLKGNKQI